MAVLRRLPTDGTFDQLRPLYRLVGFQESYCFDLKWATDRWPRSFQLHMLGLMFGYSRAESVVGSCLGDSVFSLLPPLVKRSSSVDFVTGQPLEYLASWPLFPLKSSLCCVSGGRTGLSRSSNPIMKLCNLGWCYIHLGLASCCQISRVVGRPWCSRSPMKSLSLELALLSLQNDSGSAEEIYIFNLFLSV